MAVQFVSRYGNKMNINNVDLSRGRKLLMFPVHTASMPTVKLIWTETENRVPLISFVGARHPPGSHKNKAIFVCKKKKTPGGSRNLHYRCGRQFAVCNTCATNIQCSGPFQRLFVWRGSGGWRWTSACLLRHSSKNSLKTGRRLLVEFIFLVASTTLDGKKSLKRQQLGAVASVGADGRKFFGGGAFREKRSMFRKSVKSLTTLKVSHFFYPSTNFFKWKLSILFGKKIRKVRAGCAGIHTAEATWLRGSSLRVNTPGQVSWPIRRYCRHRTAPRALRYR